MSTPRFARVALALLYGTALAATAQVAPPPPPPPPATPLGDPAVPAANPLDPARVLLGEALFWDEQLSLTGTVACGTCHQPVAGGSDPRAVLAPAASRHPGPDGIAGTADDVIGAAGVPQHAADGHYVASADFGLRPQVGSRQAPAAINAAFFDQLFWDGRAGTQFFDPDGAAELIASGGALENQALGPVVNSVEMAALGGDLEALVDRLWQLRPLQLAASIPAPLAEWIDHRAYPALFAEAFGSSGIDAARIAFAIASYERTLVANQTPFDEALAGQATLDPQERAGRQVFASAGCGGCHAGALLSDDRFHYIGVRPQAADSGRFAVTGNNGDRGAMHTPSLRNIELSAPYMADGRFATLEEVIDFYDRGGDFDAPNKPAVIRPLGLSATQRADLAAFLRRPLTDPRVLAESGPFEHPQLYTDSTRPPQPWGEGRPGPRSAKVPTLIALEPPIAGADGFSIGIEDGLPGATAWAVLDVDDPLSVDDPTRGLLGDRRVVLDEDGRGTLELRLPDRADLLATPLYLRIHVDEDGSGDASAFAVSQAVRFELIVLSQPVFGSGFE